MYTVVCMECIVYLDIVFFFQGSRGGVGTKGERGERGEKVRPNQAHSMIYCMYIRL